jgi:hypothetical protein
VRAGDGGDLGFIGRPRWLDRVPVAGGGEERFPHGRVLDEVEQVGGVAPQVRRRGVRSSRRSCRQAAILWAR